MKHSFILLLIIVAACGKKTPSNIVVQKNLSDNELYTVTYLTDSIGFIGGGLEYTLDEIYKTTDAGATWVKKAVSTNFRKSIRRFFVQNNGTIMALGSSGYMAMSKDTGETWVYKQLPNYTDIRDAIQIKDTIILAVGKSTKGFLTYIDTNGNFIKEETYHHEMTGIAMNGHTNGYASAYSAVLKTTDAGQTWQYTTAKNDIYKSLLVLSNSDAIICGYDGSIKRTTDGGDTWLHIKNSNALTTTYRWNQLIQLNANIAVVIGDAGKIALVNLRDNSYNIISSIIAADILGGCKKNSSTIALCCSNGEYIELGL